MTLHQMRDRPGSNRGGSPDRHRPANTARSLPAGADLVEPYLHTEDVAFLLGCKVRTVHELTRERRIPYRILPGTRRCLFAADELRAWSDGAPLEVVELDGGGRIVRPKVAA